MWEAAAEKFVESGVVAALGQQEESAEVAESVSNGEAVGSSLAVGEAAGSQRQTWMHISTTQQHSDFCLLQRAKLLTSPPFSPSS